ncbi:MAG: helix-turn-helix domain-containing protein [Deltaproteobacteria bacterium]|nr:helix-turn-helix domain-containing protein [Deltaproteobacteria bacterium]
MNTKEMAGHLGIHEKRVYALIRQKRVPASRVTGKWLFPKNLVDEWIERDVASGFAEAKKKGSRIGGALLAAGSNDAVLDILQSEVRKTNPDILLFSSNTGIKAGLAALNKGYCMVPSA